MHRVSAKFVLRLIKIDLKQRRMEVEQDMLDCVNGDIDFTGGESRVYKYNPETKEQSSQWRHSSFPRPNKARQVGNNVEVMLTILFEWFGVMHHEARHYQRVLFDVIRRLYGAVRRKRKNL